MTEKWVTAIATILIAIVGVAVIAVLVSPSSKTGSVLGATAGGFADVLCTALSPLGYNCASQRGLIPTVNSTIIFGT